MSARRYIAITATIFVILSLTTAALNFVVDPYLVFGSKRLAGFNDVKVDINEIVRTTKAYHPTFARWDTLLVGNSRIEMGLDPQHSCFQLLGYRVYNLGIPGAGVRQQLEYALNIIYEQDIDRVFVSLDFVDFLLREGTEPPGPHEGVSGLSSLRYEFDGSANPDFRWTAAKQRYQSLFSLKATWSSLRTILLQSETRPDRDDYGFNPARDFANSVAIEGPSALFIQKLESLDARYDGEWRFTYADGSLSNDFPDLDRFLEIAHERNIAVTLFTNPFHEEFWRLLESHDLVDLHEQWLQRLVILLESSVAKPTFWNFSADSEYIHEPLPADKSIKTPLRWFWEPAHYRKELGDLMLDSMLSDQCGSAREFGARDL